jgi:hypothetical protein
LDRRKLRVDHHKLRFRFGYTLGYFFHFAGANEGRRLGRRQGSDKRINNIKIYGLGQTNGFRQFALRIPVSRLGFSPGFPLNVNNNCPGEFWAFNLEIYAGT